jgi:anti-sigma B factor antagonist
MLRVQCILLAMPVSLRKEGSTAILEIEGKLSLGPSVDEFRAKWTDAVATGSRDLVVNMARVPMVDSSGIGSLIRCHSAVTAKGGKLKLVAVGDVVRQSFKVTRLDRVFEFHESEAAALSNLRA